MKELICAESQDDRLLFRCITDGRTIDPGRNAFILASRLDCDVRILSVPPVASRQIRPFIRYRLRNLYPGDPDDTLFDYRVTGTGDGRRAVAYLMKRQVMERYRPFAKRGRLLASDQLLRCALGRLRDATVIFVREAYVELLRYEGRELVESSVRPAGGRLDLPAAFRLAHGRAAPSDTAEARRTVSPIWIAERRDDPRLPAMIVESGAAPGAGIRSVAEAIAGARLTPWQRRRMALFRPRRVPGLPPHPIAAMVLVALTLALGALHVRETVGRYERRLERVRSEYLRRQTMTGDAQATEERLAGLETRLRALARRRPRDPYAMLSRLADVVAGASKERRAAIESISLAGSSLTVEGSAPDPFAIAEALSRQPGFSRVRVLQVLPAGEGGPAHFTIQGNYDDR